MDEDQIADRLRTRINRWEAYITKPAPPLTGSPEEGGTPPAGELVPVVFSQGRDRHAHIQAPLVDAMAGLEGTAEATTVARDGGTDAQQDRTDYHVADLRSALEHERERGQALEQAMARQQVLYAMTLRAEQERTKHQRVADGDFAAPPVFAAPTRRRRGQRPERPGDPSRVSAKDAWTFLAVLLALVLSLFYLLTTP